MVKVGSVLSQVLYIILVSEVRAVNTYILIVWDLQSDLFTKTITKLRNG
jgi:hypothetical protein